MNIHFDARGIGYSHVQRGTPCQDMSMSFPVGGLQVAVVADGHGNMRHFRSERGSRFACEITREVLCEELGGLPSLREALTARADELIGRIKARIVSRWFERVMEDAAAEPFTDQELQPLMDAGKTRYVDEYRAGKRMHVAYGSTLIAAVAAEDCWFAVQLGDGLTVITLGDGYYHFPMLQDDDDRGVYTSSLCMAYPMDDFTHCWGLDQISELFVCTDGIEKCFAPRSPKLTSMLHSIAERYRHDPKEAQTTLEQFLPAFSQKSAVQDDVSIAGIVSLDNVGGQAKPSTAQLELELRRLNAQRASICETIRYHEELCEQEEKDITRLTDEWSVLRQKIDKKQQTLQEELQAVLANKREELADMDERIRQATENLENERNSQTPLRMGGQPAPDSDRAEDDELIWYEGDDGLL